LKDDQVFLKHILDEIEFILNQSCGIELPQLMQDGKLQRALLRSLEVIGEATKNLSDGFRVKNQQVKWKEIAGLRDKLIHFYFGVDWALIWNVVKEKIPRLKEDIEKLR
jgi:uncharacterized protein with HEPN domain